MDNNLPQFSKIDLTTVVAQLEQQLQHNLAGIEQLLSHTPPFTWQNLMLPLEEQEDQLNQFWSPINHLHSVADSDQLREVYNQCLPLLTEYSMTVSHNQRLFQAIKSIADSPEYQQLSSAQRKVIDNQLRDFKLAGVALPSDKQQQFAELVTDLSQLTTKFEENVLDATKAWTKLITDRNDLNGLPEIAVQTAAATAQKRNQSGWLLTLDPPSYRAVVTYADSAPLRQEIYTASVTRASEQGPNAGQWNNHDVIERILAKRLQTAKLLDFENYAQESLATKMVKSPQQVLDFLQQLLTAILPKAQQEFKQLSQFAQQHYGIETLQAWDVAYYSEKLRQHAYAISQEELRPYFPEPHVLAGLFSIIERLYRVRISLLSDADTWHPDARCYLVSDLEGHPRSYFYLDLYARSNKRGGAWMDGCRVRRKRADGHLQLAVAYVNCNFNGPTGHDPALLTHDDVITLFHECGHALHHLLTKIDYADVSGINGVPWDAVEFPSQFFENWAWERQAVDLFAAHYQTQAPLPQELYLRMWRAKNFQSAMSMLRQLEFALYDFRLHLEYNSALDNQAQTILDEVRRQTCLYPIPAFNRFQNSFSHIFAGGYAAGYYSYYWAEVMACDAFALFKQSGIFNPEISHKFLANILEQGGAQDPQDLFIQFRGRAPQVEALLLQHGITDNG